MGGLTHVRRPEGRVGQATTTVSEEVPKLIIGRLKGTHTLLKGFAFRKGSLHTK